MLSLDSFREVMLYGYSSAGWHEVTFLASKVSKSYCCLTPCRETKTLSGRAFIKLTEPTDTESTDALYKNALVAVVIENYLRKKEGSSIIPVIFCLESTDVGAFPTSEIANKNLDKAPELGKISKAELRRMYKLCSDPCFSSEVKEIARATFKFVHVKIPSLELEECQAPWEKEPQDWTEAWKLKALSKTKSKVASDKLNWRSLLVDPTKAHKMMNPKKRGPLCLIQ